MTNQEILAVVQAANDRKPIQSRAKQCPPYAPWCDDDAPTWNFAGREYRVKPVPREWWMVSFTDPLLKQPLVFVFENDAIKYCQSYKHGFCEISHVREVLDWPNV